MAAVAKNRTVLVPEGNQSVLINASATLVKSSLAAAKMQARLASANKV